MFPSYFHLHSQTECYEWYNCEHSIQYSKARMWGEGVADLQRIAFPLPRSSLLLGRRRRLRFLDNLVYPTFNYWNKAIDGVSYY